MTEWAGNCLNSYFLDFIDYSKNYLTFQLISSAKPTVCLLTMLKIGIIKPKSITLQPKIQVWGAF